MRNRYIKMISVIITALAVMLITANCASAALVGDIEGENGPDGVVTAGDARLVLRAAVGLEALSEEQTAIADTDDDGVLSSSDARTVLRMGVGLDAVRHYFTKTVTLAPTCTEAGSMTLTCTECEEAPVVAPIEALGHSETKEVITPVTCETDGVNKCTCTVCGNVREEKVPLGHIWNMTTSTCTEDQFCTRGNHIGEAKKGHTVPWGKCTRCNIFNTEKYAVEAATIKTKFNEAKTAFDKAYSLSSYNAMLDGTAWKIVGNCTQARPEYVKARDACQAAADACKDHPEFAEIKALLLKNVENLNGSIAAVDNILKICNGNGAVITDGNLYEKVMEPLETYNVGWWSSDFKDHTYANNTKIAKAIVW